MKEFVEKLKGSDGKYQNDFFVQYFSTCSYGEICTICRLFESTYKENVLDVIKNIMDIIRANPTSIISIIFTIFVAAIFWF